MPKCDPRVFVRCPYNATCISPEQTDFEEGSDCFLFNKKVLENPVTNADKIRGDERHAAVNIPLYNYKSLCGP